MNDRTNTLIAAVPLVVALAAGTITTVTDSIPVATMETVPAGVREVSASMEPFYGDDRHLSICSFNIQFLGSFKNRDNAALV